MRPNEFGILFTTLRDEKHGASVQEIAASLITYCGANKLITIEITSAVLPASSPLCDMTRREAGDLSHDAKDGKYVCRYSLLL